MTEDDGQLPVGAVRDGHRFDEPALRHWLGRHIDGFRGELMVRQFRGGPSNPTFLLTPPDRHYVMRAKPGPAARLLPSAHAVDREFHVMRALAGAGVPVPRVHALCEDEDVIGRAFYVMDHVGGRVLWDPALPDQAPAERTVIYDAMNDVIARLHRVGPDAIGLHGYGKSPERAMARQIRR